MTLIGRFFRYHWVELLFFSVITAIYVAGVSPDMTWMSLGGDQPNYVAAAKHCSPAGLVGYPSFVLIGWLFERLPFNDFWNLGLLSALSAVAAGLFIYLIVKHFVTSNGESVIAIDKETGVSGYNFRKRLRGLAPYVAAATFYGSFIVWTQSVIPEVYTFSILLMCMGIYLTVTHRYWVAAIIFAISMGAHPLLYFSIVPCIGYIYYKERSWPLTGWVTLITAAGVLLYLQRYITADPTKNPFFIDDPMTLMLRASGGYFTLPVIPFGPTLERGGELLAMILASCGFAIPLLFMLKHWWNTRKAEVVLLSLVGAVLFLSYALSFYPQWVTYLSFSAAILAIFAGLGFSKLPSRIGVWASVYAIIPIFLILMNLQLYDIGNTVDPQPTTARQFYNELEKIPDKSIVVIHTWGHAGVLCYYYTSETNDRIDFVNYNTIGESSRYTNYIPYQESRGINLFELPLEAVKNRQYGVSDFAKDLQWRNANRNVYVTYLKKMDPAMEFGLSPSATYTGGLNDVPESKKSYAGR